MNNNTFVHKYIASLIGKDDICVDMTAGNGNDTLFLAERCKHVYAFDISPAAIEKSRKRLKNMDNVTLICDDHVHVERHVEAGIRLFVFNLGYLPHSDHPTVTEAEKTLLAFRKAYELLQEHGYIVMTFYLRHPGGRDEFYLLDSYLRKQQITILESYRQDKIDSPITFIIRKDQSKASA